MRRLACVVCMCFFFNDTATTEIYALSLHDALPISAQRPSATSRSISSSTTRCRSILRTTSFRRRSPTNSPMSRSSRSEEHTSELQSRQYLVCRLLLEKKNLQFLDGTSLHPPAPTLQ